MHECVTAACCLKYVSDYRHAFYRYIKPAPLLSGGANDEESPILKPTNSYGATPPGAADTCTQHMDADTPTKKKKKKRPTGEDGEKKVRSSSSGEDGEKKKKKKKKKVVALEDAKE